MCVCCPQEIHVHFWMAKNIGFVSYNLKPMGFFFIAFEVFSYVIISALDVVFPLVKAPSHLISFQFQQKQPFFSLWPRCVILRQKKKIKHTSWNNYPHASANIDSVLHCLRHADTTDGMEFVVVLVWKYEANNDSSIGMHWYVFLAFFLHTHFQESDQKKNDPLTAQPIPLYVIFDDWITNTKSKPCFYGKIHLFSFLKTVKNTI